MGHPSVSILTSGSRLEFRAFMKDEALRRVVQEINARLIRARQLAAEDKSLKLEFEALTHERAQLLSRWGDHVVRRRLEFSILCVRLVAHRE
jgi:hypothetical protein